MMGIDLSLKLTFGQFSQKYIQSLDDFFVISCIQVMREHRLFDAIREEVAFRPLPMPMCHHTDEGLRTDTTDAYGKPLTYVKAGDLARLKGRGWYQWNEAILAFVSSIDPEVWIVLYHE
jgi:hypothetical protein